MKHLVILLSVLALMSCARVQGSLQMCEEGTPPNCTCVPDFEDIGFPMHPIGEAGGEEETLDMQTEK